MEKTLQQQYILIKEGKGNKDHFLKQARHLFPEFITPNNDYNTTVHILKSKSILNEGVGGVITSNPNKPNWFKIFDTNLKEAIGVKNTKEYGDQNEFEKIDKNVQDALNHQFDNKDEKNIDNVYGQSFLMGYYTEMKDPKNADKTVDELKAIVLKNMVKDINYYHTEASFGVKGIGYTKDVVGGGDPVAPKGKFKSSGYGDMPKTKVVKEGMEDSSKTYAVYELAFGQPYNFYNEEKDKFIWSEPKEATLYTKEEAELKRRELLEPRVDYYQKTGNNYKEIHVGDLFKKNILREGKKPNVHSRIKDLEKQNEVLALESKIAALDEAINELTQKVSLSESDDLAEMMDPKKINELKKDIKILEKYKMTCEKKLSKLGGKKPVVDNATELNENMSAENIAAEYGTAEYINPESIKYDEGDEGWNLEFTMTIPKEDVMKMDNVSEADDYFYKQYNVNSYQGPGSSFTKSFIGTTDGGDNWIVDVNVYGGLDI